MYMEGFRCKVTGTPGNAALDTPKPPMWCEDDASACVKGAKQMVYWNQLEGNNVEVSGSDRAGDPRAPTYNMKMGFSNGESRSLSVLFLFYVIFVRRFFLPPYFFIIYCADQYFWSLGAQTDIFRETATVNNQVNRISPSVFPPLVFEVMSTLIHMIFASTLFL